MKKAFLSIVFFLTSHLLLWAQGDGPRSFMLAPKGVTGLSIKWMGLNQNIIPAGTGFIPGAELNANVFPIGVFHTFSLKGRFAQALFVAVPGKAGGTVVNLSESIPLPATSVSTSGFSDGVIGFRLGLIGAPAMNAIEFAKAPMKFSLFGDIRYWYSGSYDQKSLLNMGTNRGSVQVMAPMAIPLNENKDRSTWLEIVPSVMFFGKNDAPARNPVPGSPEVNEVTQQPLLMLENHISHSINPKLYGFAGLLYQYGGESSADGVKDDNVINILGAGFGMGYKVLPALGVKASYGTVIFGYNGAESEMIRIHATFSFVNMKKAKAELGEN